MTPDTDSAHETTPESPKETVAPAAGAPATTTPDVAAAAPSAVPATAVAPAATTPWYQTTGAKIALAAGGVLLVAAFSFSAGVRFGARSSMAAFGPRAAMSMQQGSTGPGAGRMQPGPGMQRSPSEGMKQMPGAGQRMMPRDGTRGEADSLEPRQRLPEGHPDPETAPEDDSGNTGG